MIELGTERTGCPICERKESRPFFNQERNGHAVNFVVCISCGMVYQNPRLSEEEFRRYYRSEFRKQNLAEDELTRYIQSRVECGQRVLKVIEREFFRDFGKFLVAKYRGYGGFSVLDVGCGVGGLLLPFKAKGFNCHGVDVPSEYTRIGRERLNLEITETMIAEYPVDRKYDVVILNHCLEHILHPVSDLKKIRSLLKPGGLLYVEVPDVERPYAWETLKFFFMLGHVCYFSPETLRTLLNKSGFQRIWFDNKATPFMRCVFKPKKNFRYKVNPNYYSRFRRYFEALRQDRIRKGEVGLESPFKEDFPGKGEGDVAADRALA